VHGDFRVECLVRRDGLARVPYQEGVYRFLGKEAPVGEDSCIALVRSVLHEYGPLAGQVPQGADEFRL
jgi:hypothetical protein